jgi:cell wall-associated NlpC family hydrolase
MRRKAIVAEAESWIGTPYVHQASRKGVGCDCLGLVRGVWRAVVGPEPEPMPPYAADWAEAGGRETLLAAAERWLVDVGRSAVGSRQSGIDSGIAAELRGGRAAVCRTADPARPGDVLLFRWKAGLPAKHAAIVVAPGVFVHAHDGRAVARAALAPWWQRRLAGVFSFPGIED